MWVRVRWCAAALALSAAVASSSAAADMRDAGAIDEEVARELVDMRNQAKAITRAGMTPEEARILEERNTAKYGNPLGPTADRIATGPPPGLS